MRQQTVFLAVVLSAVLASVCSAEEQASEQAAKAQAKACMNQLKMCGVVFMRYSDAAEGGAMPLLDACPSRLMWQKDNVYPTYLEDPTIMICPEERPSAESTLAQLPPEARVEYCFDHSSYWYLGYALPDEATALAFVRAFTKQIQAGGSFENDLRDEEQRPILRLRNGVVKSLLPETSDRAQWVKLHATIPVMIEKPGRHQNAVNVLFLDGHVERCAYPGTYPASAAFIEALTALQNAARPHTP